MTVFFTADHTAYCTIQGGDYTEAVEVETLDAADVLLVALVEPENVIDGE